MGNDDSQKKVERFDVEEMSRARSIPQSPQGKGPMGFPLPVITVTVPSVSLMLFGQVPRPGGRNMPQRGSLSCKICLF